MVVRVILPRSLVSLIPGTARTTEVEAATVSEALDRLDDRTPGLRNRLVDSGPTIREHINVFVNGERERDLGAALAEGADVHVIPAVAGG